MSTVRIKNWTEITNQPKDRDLLIHDYLAVAESMMIYAPAGVGKTYNALNLSVSLAVGGEFYNDQVNAVGGKVFFVDGELGQDAVESRLCQIIKSRGLTSIPNLLTLCCDSIDGESLPDLSWSDKQIWLTRILIAEEVKVLVLDNYNTLFDDNGDLFACWQRVSVWFRKLQALGITVILIHHTNKAGVSPAGTAKMSQMMDAVLSIKPSPLALPSETLIEVVIEKSRYTSPKPKKLARLVDGKLIHLDYNTELSSRLKRDFSEWGLSYVTSKYDVPSWKIREICGVRDGSRKSTNESLGELDKLDKLTKKSNLFI